LAPAPLALLLALGMGTAPIAAAPPKRAPRKPAAAKAKPSPAKPAAAPLAISRLAVEPASATLSGPRAVQHFVVTATLPNGDLVDVTANASFRSLAPKVARLAGPNVVAPVADGETKIVARVGNLEASADLKVEGASQPATLSFVNDVMPVLSKQGCNASACHGSPVGKGGFKLSLFGYEPELDQKAIKDSAGRRVDLKQPEKSLILQKPTMTVAHGGGLRFKKDSPEYATLLAWIRAGAPGMSQLEARVRRIEVTPDDRLMPGPNTVQRLVVTATLSDGSTLDVTDKALYSSNDDSVVAVSPQGVLTAKVPGETAIMVRHLGRVAVARVAVLPPTKIARWPDLPRGNFIDDAVFAKLKKIRVLPSDLSTDEEFLRRAYLDTIGMVPAPDEVRAFLKDRDPQKRSKLIDQLLDRPEFVDVWTLKWNDLLRNNPRLTRTGLASYYNWIRDQVAKDVPYDQFVRSLLTATGANDQVGPVNYYLVSRDPLDLTSATSQVFLGVRIECARCHNHPFEKWTQNDYYGLAGFFSNIRRIGNGNQMAAQVIVGPPNRRLQVRNPKTNQPVEPKVLDDTEIKPDTEDLRVALADWITSPQNPFFARAIANRVWAHYMGRGIIDPVDDIRVTNPPSNPELLDALAKDLVEKKFDLKALMRDLMNSRVYQLSSRANETNRQDQRNFARAYPKRLTAEQLYDSISQACGAFTPFFPQRRGGGMGMGGAIAQAVRDAMDPGATRAHQIPIPRVPGEVGTFLDVFGRPRREVVCECERSSDGSVTQALVLLNSDLVNRKIEFPLGRVQQLVRSNRPDPEAIEELYLATLSRRPTAAEMADAQSLVRSGKTRQQGYQDLMWGLLNCREFLFNH
jgi:hypothetical protein